MWRRLAPGLFLFNYFASDGPGLAADLWDCLAGLV
jgi:hypothetical protein